jgi:hypothetical protein
MDTLKKKMSRTRTSKHMAEKGQRGTISMLDKTHRLSWGYQVSRAADLQASMSTLRGTAQTKTREIHFIGEQRKTLLLPLLLMKERLRTAIPDILTCDSEHVSACHTKYTHCRRRRFSRERCTWWRSFGFGRESRLSPSVRVLVGRVVGS